MRGERLSLFKTNEPGGVLSRLIEKQPQPIEGKRSRLSSFGAWSFDRGATSIGPVQRPDFCDLAWPCKTGRMLVERQQPPEKERNSWNESRATYERFEVAYIRGSATVRHRFEFRPAIFGSTATVSTLDSIGE